MPLFHILVLAMVQGITEFLPISSSAHLILVPKINGWPDQGLAFDVAVHVGTLGAVAVYLWRDVGSIFAGLYQATRRRFSPGLRLLGVLIVATIPVGIIGFLVEKYVGDGLRSVQLIAWASIGFGLLLYVVDRISLTVNRMEHVGIGAAIIIGLAQVLALIPGTSRSGITMTAARMLGYERTDAARFSMLMSIPVILAAGLLKGYKIYKAEDVQLGLDALIGGAIAFVAALIAIAAMMSWLKKASFTPFVIYRIILGFVLLAWVYGWMDGILPSLSAG
ncbi:MAG: undecaprenyl-diphosphate phosphatase [Alphaproteobacteria bacterium]